MTADQRAIHVVLVLISFAIALILGGGDEFGTSRYYDWMARLWSQPTWSLVFLMAGNVGFVGLFSPWRILQLGSIGAMSTLHALFAVLILLGLPRSPGLPAFIGIAALGYWLLYRQTFRK